MLSPVNLSLAFLLAVPLAFAELPAPWPILVASIGISQDAIAVNQPLSETQIEQGAFLILTGESPAASAFGFAVQKKRVQIQSVIDARAPKLPIIWEKAVDLPLFEIPAGAIVFARERWTNAPVLAGFRKGKGAVLWLAAAPGDRGYERFPYLLQAMTDLGLKARFRDKRLWAFFDGSYRSRVDLEYFAERWRKAGIATLHVAAWHYNEADAERDAFLAKLIEACHRNAITVYAWLELPHVSEKLWNDHPEWREKTGLLQDAHLDWRKLMNLNNPECFRAVSASTHALLDRFDWDGVNLAELYFESLEGAANPSRMTPFNDNVRRAFEREKGIDPVSLLQPAGAGRMPEFLEWRAELARKMQVQWIGEMEAARKLKPHLDLVLTHVDDRFDTRMRDLIGADAARVLPMLDTHNFTFLIEDPATIWHLGPERYPQIATRYQPLTTKTDKLAIDINIVERYQDVYPTKQQTGGELFQLVHVASQAFPRVALYFENSILKPDLELLPAASAIVTGYAQSGTRTTIDSPHGVGLAWQGAAKLDGKLWPVLTPSTLWVPAGHHIVEPAAQAPSVRLIDFNGKLKSATARPNGLEFGYTSDSRAIAILDQPASGITIDGIASSLSGTHLLLPRGQHRVILSLN
jgi:hypothetical protein